MKFLNKLIDGLYDVFEYLVLLVIVIIALLVIHKQYNIMHEKSLIINQKDQANQEESEVREEETFEEIKEVTIVIPEGTHSLGIYTILQEYGLVGEESDILPLLESLPEEDLPSGSYKIRLGLSNEELKKTLDLQ